MEGDAECIIQERNKKNKTKYIHHRGLNSMHAKSPPFESEHPQHQWSKDTAG